jgi:murein DD-endopeptidase MepM/ murein hydrolase activator NlpD
MAPAHGPRRIALFAALALAASVSACSMGGPLRDANRREAPVASQRPPSGTYNVIAGDTIYVVARRFGISVRALIDANGLRPPFQLNPGQVLRLPNGGDYIVTKGDTLYGVARKTGVEFSTLARINNLTAPYVIRVGQRLMLPAEATTERANAATASADTVVIQSPNVGQQGTVRAAPVESMKIEALPAPNAPPKETTTFGTASRPGLVAEAGPATKTVTPPSNDRPLAEREVAAPSSAPSPAPASSGLAESNPPPPPSTESPRLETATASPARPPAAAAGPGFIWPVKGTLLASFGSTAKGQHNDGVNIAVPKGTPVLAAGDGTVVYVGNELRGFGNLLLIKHGATGYITAYANTDKILVRKGEHVMRGQKVALSGDTGGVSPPQLHFELRQGAKAIDPQSVLPGDLSPAASQAGRQDPG